MDPEDTMQEFLAKSINLWELVRNETEKAVHWLRKIEEDIEATGGPRDDAPTPFEIIRLKRKLDALSEEFSDIAIGYERLLKPAVKWFEPDQQKIQMAFYRGDEPWNFALTYPNRRQCELRLLKILREKQEANTLPPLRGRPSDGHLVLCSDGMHLFRAVVLSSSRDGRCTVSNVDGNEQRLVRQNCLYEIPAEVFDQPCLNFRCCVTQDEFLKKVWCKKLGEGFKHVLKKWDVLIDVLEQIDDSKPPLFQVTLYLRNNQLDKIIDLGKWFDKKLIPRLKAYNSTDLEYVVDSKCWKPFL